MNRAEQVVSDRYAADGWQVFHTGAPDFLLRRQTSDGQTEYLFSEVKNDDGELRPDQLIWREALESLGAVFRVDRESDPYPDRRIPVALNQSKYDLLTTIAHREKRSASAQAALYIEKCLEVEEP